MQLMTWFVEYKNGEIHREHEIEFNTIQRDQIKCFGLEGMETVFTHHVDSGQFELGENKICFLLNDRLIGKSTDIINFKEKIAMLYGDGGGIIGYYTGWKEHTEEFSYVEVLFWVDIRDQSLKLRLRLTPLQPSCKFNMIINGVLNERELVFEETGKKKEFVFEL